MTLTKEQIILTKDQVKNIATNAAKKALETQKNLTTEEKLLCVAGAAVGIAALAVLKVTVVAHKTKKRVKACEKRLDALEGKSGIKATVKKKLFHR